MKHNVPLLVRVLRPFFLSAVIPGPERSEGPGIHNPSRGYGFRARRFARTPE